MQQSRRWKIRDKQNSSMQLTHSFLEAHKQITPRTIRIKTQPDINQDCISIINGRAPNHIAKFLKTKGRFGSLCTQLHSKLQSELFDKIYFQERTRIINSMQKLAVKKEQLRMKLGLYRKEQRSFHEINKDDISYFERKFGKSKQHGKYRQRMHPLCRLYSQSVEQTCSNRKIIDNPFQQR